MEHYWLVVGRVMKQHSSECLRVLVLRDDNARDEIPMGAFEKTFSKKNAVLNVTVDSRGLHGKGVDVRQMPRYTGQKGRLTCIGAGMSENDIIRLAKPHIDKFLSAQRKVAKSSVQDGEYKYLTQEYRDGMDKYMDNSVDGFTDVCVGIGDALVAQNYLGAAKDIGKGWMKLNNGKYYHRQHAVSEAREIAKSLDSDEERKEFTREMRDYNMKTLGRSIDGVPERKVESVKKIVKTVGAVAGVGDDGKPASKSDDLDGLKVIDGGDYKCLVDKSSKKVDTSCLFSEDD